MKKGITQFFILILLPFFILSGCSMIKSSQSTITSITSTHNFTTTTNETMTTTTPTIFEDFKVGEYFMLTSIDQNPTNSITFYDEVDREIQTIIVDTNSYLIKVPEYTHRIVTVNLALERVEFNAEVYPITQEIKDEEFGGEQPVYILKEQLTLGIYEIKFRDYLEDVWNLNIYKNNELVGTYSKRDDIFSSYDYLFYNSENFDFDYIRLYNCSIIYKEPVPETE